MDDTARPRPGYPIRGSRSTPNGAETEAVTAYSVARLASNEAEADSLWARRLSVVGLAAATATFVALAVQLRTGFGDAEVSSIFTN